MATLPSEVSRFYVEQEKRFIAPTVNNITALTGTFTTLLLENTDVIWNTLTEDSVFRSFVGYSFPVGNNYILIPRGIYTFCVNFTCLTPGPLLTSLVRFRILILNDADNTDVFRGWKHRTSANQQFFTMCFTFTQRAILGRLSFNIANLEGNTAETEILGAQLFKHD